MIPEATVQDVLNKADILQVIGEYTRLKRFGHSYKGLCPLHHEKSPSFHVTPSKGLFYCFGCNVGGTTIDFIQEIEGLSFPETIRLLGERFGIDIPEGGEDVESYQRRRHEKEILLDLMWQASLFFSSSLKGEGGEFALSYLNGRGIAEATESFLLGFAPEGWSLLGEHLEQKGFSQRQIEAAGLVISKEHGGSYDRFRNRLIFPVLDPRGRVVAFGGRTLDPSGEKGAKYINSPETSIYHKGSHLYGLHIAKESIRRKKQAILVEGNVDVVRMHLCGFSHCIASMGTALTMDQARLIGRYTPHITLLFDGDTAGIRAARKAFFPLREAGLEASVVLLPKGEDPDTFLALYGAEELQVLIDAALPLLQWSLDQICEQILIKPIEQRAQSLDALTDFLRELRPAIVQRHYLTESARRLGFAPGELLTLTGLRLDGDASNGSQNSLKERPPGEPGMDPAEFEFLQVLLRLPERIQDFVESRYLRILKDTRLHTLFEALGRRAEVDPNLDIERTIQWLEPGPPRDLALRALTAPCDWSGERLDDAYRGAISQLMNAWIERQTTRICNKIEQSLAEGSHEELSRLLAHQAKLERLRPALSQNRKIDWDRYNQTEVESDPLTTSKD